MIRTFVIVFATMAALGAAPAASAQWTLCNESSFIVEAAVVYPDAGEAVTEGWIRMRPGECADAVNRPLETGTHHLYARTSDAHQGGRREWSGIEPFCVDDFAREFFFSGAGTNCEDVGAATRGFAAIDVDTVNWRTRFVEPEPPAVGGGLTTAKSRVAGLQRLLSDAGFYDASRIDGITGRRTDRAVNRYLRSIERSARPAYPQLIDLLEVSARENASNRGLKVCNRLGDDGAVDDDGLGETGEGASVWAAFARRQDTAWESRGWWKLGPGECAKIVNETINENSYYYYAEIVTENDATPLAGGAEAFCIARARFAIVGRSECAGRGYRSGVFRLAPGSAGEVVIDLSDADFDLNALRSPG